MRAGPSGRIALLVLPLLLGLLGMHALVVGPAAGTAGAHPDLPAASSSPVPGPHDHVTVPAGEHDGAPHTSPGHGSHDGGPGHLLHLCLAVLAVLGVVLLAAGALLGRVPRPRSTGRDRRRPRTTAVAHPPPVPRRLAQLCVMRN